MAPLADDIGSYPLPPGVTRKDLASAALCTPDGTASSLFSQTVADAFSQKLDAGLDVATFPQFRDMIASFTEPIDGCYEKERPWIVQEKHAVLPELSFLEQPAQDHFERTGEKVNLRIAVTGPLELYFAAIGPHIDAGLLANLGESIGRFVKNSRLKTKYLETTTVSIDEPSLGFQPNMVVEDDALIRAWERAVAPAKGLDVQIHLHSSVSVDRVYATRGISVIGVESAEDPRALDTFEKRELERHDKYLRVGVARTNVYGLASDYLGEAGVDVWKTPDAVPAMVDTLESPTIIAGRIKRALDRFGDRVAYVGPDCGLSAWPTQESAKKLLENTVAAKGLL